jgi:hypothetical protein
MGPGKADLCRGRGRKLERWAPGGRLLPQAERRDDSGGDEQDLLERVCVDPTAVEVGHEIGHGDADKAGRSDGERVGEKPRRAVEGEKDATGWVRNCREELGRISGYGVAT